MPRRLALGLAGAFTVGLALVGAVLYPSLGRTPLGWPGVTATAPSVPATATPFGQSSASPSNATATSGSDRGRAWYCALDDRLTPYRGYDDYARTYLDWTYALPADYAPRDLAAVSSAGFGGESRSEVVRAIVIADLAALRAAAGAAGHHLTVLSGYRSYTAQQSTFNYWIGIGGYEQALRTSARAGHSEHQLGTAIDFSSDTTPPWEYADWGATPPGRWLAENAWRYGFVLSYPAGKENVTCYEYEPWHFRWVGRANAGAVRESGLTLREFLAGVARGPGP